MFYSFFCRTLSCISSVKDCTLRHSCFPLKDCVWTAYASALSKKRNTKFLDIEMKVNVSLVGSNVIPSTYQPSIHIHPYIQHPSIYIHIHPPSIHPYPSIHPPSIYPPSIHIHPPSIYPTIHSLTYPPTILSTHHPIHPPSCPPTHPLTRLSIHPSIDPTYPPTHLLHPSIRPFIHPSRPEQCVYIATSIYIPVILNHCLRF